MGGRFNPSVIFVDHLETLRDFDTKRYNRVALAIFFGLPLLVGAALAGAGIVLTEGMVGILTTSMSIFAGLLFNLLMIVYDIIRKAGETDTRRQTGETEDGESAKLRNQYLREIFANISFGVLASVFVVILLLLWLVVPGRFPQIVRVVLSAVVYYSTGIFLLTFFMVLRRVHILLSREFTTAASP